MSEIMKDSAIKLFGKTITLSDVSLSERRQSSFATSDSQDSKDEQESMDPTETLTEATSSDVDDEADTPETAKNDEGSNDSNTPDEKALKKPDKIIPCPRCNSMNTKFCYYNNYNVNQPRYFCKNCQRYWTSGGTMRNVPVGSGRRKTKNVVVPGPHHIMVSQSGFFIGPDSGFPVSFYPAAPYWTVPVVSSNLGKHSREEESVVTTVSKENYEAERSMWVPKTLRIHDPSEAAKSSIWSTLGRIKNEKTGLFRAFESKGDRIVDSSTMVRQANPAALSRSLNFQEST